MKTKIEVTERYAGETDCGHWMLLLTERSALNDQIDAGREVGAEPDCMHWLEIVEDNEALLITTSDGVEKRVSTAVCSLRAKRA